jgi:hypothetical protein
MLKSGAIGTQPRDFCEVDAKVFAYFLVGDPSHADRIPIHCELENEWPKYVWHTFKLLESGPPTSWIAKEVSNVTAPILIIHGTKDRTARLRGRRELVEELAEGNAGDRSKEPRTVCCGRSRIPSSARSGDSSTRETLHLSRPPVDFTPTPCHFAKTWRHSASNVCS